MKDKIREIVEDIQEGNLCQVDAINAIHQATRLDYTKVRNAVAELHQRPNTWAVTTNDVAKTIISNQDELTKEG